MNAPLDYNLAAERATLGSILLRADAYLEIAGTVKPADFYGEGHGQVFAAIEACAQAGGALNVPTVAARLKAAGRLEQIGGVPALLELMDAPGEMGGSSHHVADTAREVAQSAVCRRLFAAAQTIARLSQQNDRPLEERLTEAQRTISDVTLSHADSEPVAFEDAGIERLDSIKNTDIVPGIPTGFRDLDELTGGLHRAELTTLAARPAVGKSALALCLAVSVAQLHGPVALFSMEMSQDEVIDRALAQGTGIDSTRYRDHRLSQQDFASSFAYITQYAPQRLFIEDKTNVSALDIRTRCMKLSARHGRLSLVVIDYLQLMQASDRYRGNRVQEVAELSRALKNLAGDLDVPVLMLSQLNRAVEGRAGHVPMLSDLRESGSIEQDSNNVWFLHREELYELNTDKKGIAELHIAKQRHGPNGVIPLRFDNATTRFADLTYRSIDNY